MGYRGKVSEQERARELRSQAWTLNEIAAELGVAKSSVSLWVRDVPFDEVVRARRAGANRNRGAQQRGPNRLAQRKQAEIVRLLGEGHERTGERSDRDLLIAGVALYAGEGAKTDGAVVFANSDPRMMRLFLRFLRHFFEIDETRLRGRLYLHQGLDLDAALRVWSAALDIPPDQFGKPYRAVPDASIRRTKHPLGCAYVKYSCSATHRAISGLMAGLLA